MIDALLVFDGVMPTTGTGAPTGSAITVTRASTNVLDMYANRDVAVGDELELHIMPLVTFTAAGAATLDIAYQTSADNATFVTLLQSPQYPVANLIAGVGLFRVKIPISQLLDTGAPNRYHRINYTVSTGPMTAGTMLAYMTGGSDRSTFIPYGPNYSIGA